MVYSFCIQLKIKLLIPPEWLLQLLQRYYFLLTFIGSANVSLLLNYIAYFSGTNNQHLNLVIPVQLLEQALDISWSPHKHWSFWFSDECSYQNFQSFWRVCICSVDMSESGGKDAFRGSSCLGLNFLFIFLVVWDIVNNDIYIIDFSINFQSLLCINATAFCALNKKRTKCR